MNLIRKHTSVTFILTAIAFTGFFHSAIAEDKKRQIEEIIVTAERVESTVSDTSISITAFSEDAIEDFGLQSADELINYIPATTRDAYDIRIRGVGRNFRALGGDPGVATYYNGVYSPDFGIAASENALYDLARVEVLRGPQGTLYGRNSIGGALNYVTKRPTFEKEGELRLQTGEFNTRELYGVLSGAFIDDIVAARIVAVDRERDGSQEGLQGSPDINAINDHNMAVSFLFDFSDNFSVFVRGNDRESERLLPTFEFMTEGAGPVRGQSSADYAVFGLRAVEQGAAGAMSFTNPLTGEVLYGAYNRPGLDPTLYPFQPNAGFGRTDIDGLKSLSGGEGNFTNMVNNESDACAFPYANQDCQHEYFGHRSSSLEMKWEINDTTTLTYIYGNQDFEYTFNIDADGYNSDFSKYRQTVLEDVWSYSHELQLQWSVGERFTATSGVFQFTEKRNQDYSLRNNTPRYTLPAAYGDLDAPSAILGGASYMQIIGFGGGGVGLGDAAMGTSISGRWHGSEDIYRHKNIVRNEQVAYFTQGTFKLNDEFSLVLGIRYAEDDKSALEIRGGYFEIGYPVFPLAPGFTSQDLLQYGPNVATSAIINGLPVGALTVGPATGLTLLGLTNIAMGRATYSGNPADPITPSCAITDAACASPLMLGPGLPISYTSTVSGDDTWSDTNYRINLDWTPNDDILMYLSLTTGYRAGGYSLGVADARDQSRDDQGIPIPGAGIEPLTYDEETVKALEVGYKGLHLDGTLQVNASIYTYDYEGYQDQLDFFDPIRNSTVDAVGNAPEATNSGFEIELLWLPTDRLTIGGNYSYTKTEYGGDYQAAISDDPFLPASLFGNATTAPDLFVVHMNGNPLKRIPEHKATGWAIYEIETSSGTFDFRGTYSYTGEYYVSGIQRSLDLLPDRHRIDLAASWTDSSDTWKVRLFVDNATDESSVRGFGTSSESSNWRKSGSTLYPRYWGLDITYTLFN